MITVKITPVNGCSIQECAYNVKKECHAKAITIGDSEFPGCDTMLQGPKHVRYSEQAGVGACKTSSCSFNDDLECTAESIKVGMNGDEVECMTFTSR